LLADSSKVSRSLKNNFFYVPSEHFQDSHDTSRCCCRADTKKEVKELKTTLERQRGAGGEKEAFQKLLNLSFVMLIPEME